MTFPTIGPWVRAWIEKYLVHGEGDFFGDPFVLDPWQRDFVDDLYQVDVDGVYGPPGSRLIRVAVLGVGKGNGKSALAAAVGNAELAGPVMPTWDGERWVGVPRMSPNIPVAAASREQASKVFAIAQQQINEGPLAPYFETFQYQTQIKDQAGVMERVAAVAGTNDGGLPTAFIADEVHEWVGRTERVHLVIANSLTKRADALNLNISTAGPDMNSLLGRLYVKGKAIQAGALEDPTFLFRWYEADTNLNIDNPKQLRKAIRQANPLSTVNVERVARRYEVDRIPAYEFRRYHLNQWTEGAEPFVNMKRFTEGAEAHRFEDAELVGRSCFIGVDLSATQDVTAAALIFDCTEHEDAIDIKLFYWLPADWPQRHPSSPLTHWAREGHITLTDGNVIDYRRIGDQLREVMSTYLVQEIGHDPWQSNQLMQELAEEGAATATVTQGGAVLTAPTKEFERLASAGLIHHNQDPVLKWMLNNVVVSETGDQRRINKSKSRDKIDGVSALITGLERWMHAEPAEFGIGWL